MPIAGPAARLSGADGREYRDVTPGAGPASFGYPHAVYPDAVDRPMRRLFSAESFCIPWNDIDAPDQMLTARSSDIALVEMQAVMGNHACCPPMDGYLQAVRALCDRNGVLPCFDEVITGYRMGLSGAQGRSGVTPDLAVGMAAGLATLTLLRSDAIGHYARVGAIQSTLTRAFDCILREHGLPCLVQGLRGIFGLRLIDRAVACTSAALSPEETQASAELAALLQQKGVLPAGGARFNLVSTTTDDVRETIRRFENALRPLTSTRLH